jgi:hypothetical protein
MNCPLQENRLKTPVPYRKKKEENVNECCRMKVFLVSCKRDILVYLIILVNLSLLKPC